MTKGKLAQQFRFLAVGVVNTAIDFGVFLLLNIVMQVPVLASNLISTSAGLTFSFFANRSFTFQASKGPAKRQVTLFLLVTLSGLWILQPLLILAILELFPSGLDLPRGVPELLAKLIATCGSLIWNFVGYKFFVFK